MKSLEGKVALVTGASRGIGRAIAEKFASEGAKVAFTYLSSVEQGKALEKELSAFGGAARGYRSDAADYQSAEKLIEQIVADLGGLDIVVNNAGITKDGLIMRMSEEQWDDVIRVNLKSVFNVSKAACKVMMRAKSGSIINMSSIVGVQGNGGQANYAASKSGIIGLTKSVAKELGSRNIRCNAIAPGFIQTEMTQQLNPAVVADWEASVPMKRMGTTNDVAELALFLASDRSGYITGQVISVCGGLLD